MSKEISAPIKQISYLSEFQCIADKCPDTCCSKWVINVTKENKEFYDQENPDLIAQLEPYSDGAYRMEEQSNGDCIQLKNKLCTLQQRCGETHLPDICYTFPRSYKKIANSTYVTANMACPESLRVALYSDKDTDFSSWVNKTQTREKTGLYDTRTGGFREMDEEGVANIANSIARMIDNPEYSADEALAKLLLLAHRMDKNADDFNWNNIQSEIDSINREDVLNISRGNIEFSDMRDELVNILDAMFDLINRDRPRYNEVVAMVREVLGDHKTDKDELIGKYEKIFENWQEAQKNYDQLLKNLIKVQLSYILFPVYNHFSKYYEAILVIFLEYLVIKLAIICKDFENGGELSQMQMVDIAQPTAKRFYVRGRQELYDFCKKVGWDDCRKAITTGLNFS